MTPGHSSPALGASTLHTSMGTQSSLGMAVGLLKTLVIVVDPEGHAQQCDSPLASPAFRSPVCTLRIISCRPAQGPEAAWFTCSSLPKMCFKAGSSGRPQLFYTLNTVPPSKCPAAWTRPVGPYGHRSGIRRTGRKPEVPSLCVFQFILVSAQEGWVT